MTSLKLTTFNPDNLKIPFAWALGHPIDWEVSGINPDQVVLEGSQWYVIWIGNEEGEWVILPGPVTWSQMVEACGHYFEDIFQKEHGSAIDYKVAGLGLLRRNRGHIQTEFPKGTLVVYRLSTGEFGGKETFEVEPYVKELEDDLEEFHYYYRVQMEGKRDPRFVRYFHLLGEMLNEYPDEFDTKAKFCAKLNDLLMTYTSQAYRTCPAEVRLEMNRIRNEWASEWIETQTHLKK